jgi:hypothetical protein
LSFIISCLSPAACVRIYNCDGQLCPTGSSDAVKEVYRRFNSAAVKLYGRR